MRPFRVLLLASTLLVRWRLARHDRRGFVIDIATVPMWTYLYASEGLWALLPIPFIFGALDVAALKKWWQV